MATEIERKFLVKNDTWRDQVESASRIAQGYLASEPRLTVRVRLRDEDAYLTIKGPTEGIGRSEFEYQIPPTDAKAMLRDLASMPPVEKVRHLIQIGPHTWELDVFEGSNAGLIMAEIELSAEDDAFELPGWAGTEVTGDPRYYNAYLAEHPFTSW
jgi:adenylate cyclase